MLTVQIVMARSAQAQCEFGSLGVVEAGGPVSFSSDPLSLILSWIRPGVHAIYFLPEVHDET